MYLSKQCWPDPSQCSNERVHSEDRAFFQGDRSLIDQREIRTKVKSHDSDTLKKIVSFFYFKNYENFPLKLANVIINIC